MMLPHATFDPEAGALVVELAEGVVAGTVAYPDDAHLVDVDEHGRALSLEILAPDRLLLAEIAARFGFDDQVSAISGAVDSVLAAARTEASWTTVEYVQATVHASAVNAPMVRSASGAWAPARELDLIK